VAWNLTASGTQAMDNSNPVTMAFDCNGADLLVVAVCVSAGSVYDKIPTYNSVSMTDCGEGLVSSGSESNVYIFYLVNPSSGSNTISLENTATKNVTFYASAWTGVDTSDPLDTAASDHDVSADPSVTITTSAAGKLILDICMDGYINSFSGNSHTLINSQDHGSQNTGNQYTTLDGSSGITLSWTCGSDDWAMIVAAFNQVHLPNRDNLLTMDYSKDGRPFVRVGTNASVLLDGMDVSYEGRPFWGPEGGEEEEEERKRIYLVL